MCPKCQLSWAKCECDITEPTTPITVPTPSPRIDPVIPFGKYKGQYASTVPIDYLDWMLGIADEPWRGVLLDYLSGRADWNDFDEDH